MRVISSSEVHGWASIRKVHVYGPATPTPAPAPTPTPNPSPAPTPTPTPSPIPRSGGPLNLNPPDGYVYNGGGTYSTSGTLTLGSNCTIMGVNFTGGGSGIQIRGSGNRVSGRTFGAHSWAALILWVGNDNVIDGNTFNDVTGSGANIQVLGGKRNQITNNVSHGGITAIVTGNTVTANNYSGVLLYGMAFGNRIENNTVLGGGIKVESVDNLIPANISATKTYGRAPCGYNTIKNNVVSGDVSLEYYAIPDMNGHANAYPAYTSVGNNVIGNRCARVEANQQVAYIANNTGTPNYSNVSLSPVEML